MFYHEISQKPLIVICCLTQKNRRKSPNALWSTFALNCMKVLGFCKYNYIKRDFQAMELIYIHRLQTFLRLTHKKMQKHFSFSAMP